MSMQADSGNSAPALEEPGRRGRLSSRRARFGVIAGLVVIVFGGGAFGIAQALSSNAAPAPSSAAPASSSPRTAPSGGPFGGRSAAPVAFGTVSSVGANSFVLAARGAGDVTVDVSSSTTFVDGSVAHPSIANVSVGSAVAVSGSKSGDVVHATQVMLGGARRGGFGGGRPAVSGTVKSVDANSFVVTSRSGGSVSVTVSSSTTYRDFSTSGASFSDLKAGVGVAVVGSTSTSGAVSATSVTILPAGFSGGGTGGGFGGGAGSGGAPGAGSTIS